MVDDDTGTRRPSHAPLVAGGGHVAAQETGSFEVGRPQAVKEGTDPQVPESQFLRAFREGRTGARWSNPDLAFEPVHDQGSKSGTTAWNEDLRVRVLDVSNSNPLTRSRSRERRFNEEYERLEAVNISKSSPVALMEGADTVPYGNSAGGRVTASEQVLDPGKPKTYLAAPLMPASWVSPVPPAEVRVKRRPSPFVGSGERPKVFRIGTPPEPPILPLAEPEHPDEGPNSDMMASFRGEVERIQRESNELLMSMQVKL